MLFNELNTKVLLDIFKCLDLIDSINLAGTCIRLRDVANLKLEKITFSTQALAQLDLSETNTLEELVVFGVLGVLSPKISRPLKDVIERNCNISSLSLKLNEDTDYEIFAKLKSLKCLRLDNYSGHFENVAANLKMTDLEKVQISSYFLLVDAEFDRIDELYIFVQKLAANALKIKDLSIHLYDRGDNGDVSDHGHPMPPLHLLDLTSFRLTVIYETLQKELPKLQPNIKHLDLDIYDLYDDFPEQIIPLIKSLKKLEVFHINTRHVVGHVLPIILREKRFLRQIFDGCSNQRPTLWLYEGSYIQSPTLRPDYGKKNRETNGFCKVKLDFNKRKCTVTTIPYKRNYFSDSMDHQSLLPCCY